MMKQIKNILFILSIFCAMPNVHAQIVKSKQPLDKNGLRVEDVNNWCCKSGNECCRAEFISNNGQTSTQPLKLFANQKISDPIIATLYDKEGKEIIAPGAVGFSDDGNDFVFKIAKLCPPKCPNEVVVVFTSGKLKDEILISNLNVWPPVKLPWKKQN